MSNSEVPMLFSNGTNWRGKPFLLLNDFIELIAPGRNFEK